MWLSTMSTIYSLMQLGAVCANTNNSVRLDSLPIKVGVRSITRDRCLLAKPELYSASAIQLKLDFISYKLI